MIVKMARTLKLELVCGRTASLWWVKQIVNHRLSAQLTPRLTQSTEHSAEECAEQRQAGHPARLLICHREARVVVVLIANVKLLKARDGGTRVAFAQTRGEGTQRNGQSSDDLKRSSRVRLIKMYPIRVRESIKQSTESMNNQKCNQRQHISRGKSVVIVPRQLIQFIFFSLFTFHATK
jgi:hypothetical protein